MKKHFGRLIMMLGTALSLLGVTLFIQREHMKINDVVVAEYPALIVAIIVAGVALTVGGAVLRRRAREVERGEAATREPL